jgi:hypothetical protein
VSSVERKTQPRGYAQAARRYREARARVDRIKVGLDGLQDLCDEVADAYTQRDWDALGYRSWADMCATEFSCAKIRLPDKDRRRLLSALRIAGMSYRAIAAATGDSHMTIQRELAAVTNVTRAVVGIDGKQYPLRVLPPRRAESSPTTAGVRQLRTAVGMLDGAVRAGAEITPDERREVGECITRLRMLIGDEDAFDDEWHEHSTAAYRRLRRRHR